MRQIFLLLALHSAAHACPPAVTISYSPALDRACGFVHRYSISNAWKEELARNIDTFRAIWANQSTALLSTTEMVVGKEFRAGRQSAYLTLCDLPSQSIFGISVNMRYALSSFTSTPAPLRYKIGVLYHEILHGFISDHIPAESPLLIQHQNEAPRVKGHLHLLALQKAVYLRLGMKKELEEVINFDGQLPSGFYKRAWQIVNQDEKQYLKYVEELKAR